MMPISLNTVDTLNPTSNALTEFLDFLLVNEFSAGAYSSSAMPSYIDKIWYPAPWFAIPEREDLIDYLEALGMTDENGISYRYAHGATTKDGKELIGVYQIGVASDWEGITLGIRFLGLGSSQKMLGNQTPGNPWS